jgi:gluconolactonase
MNGDNWGNIEGPVWIDDALYLSEMANASYTQADANVKQARMLKVTADGTVSIFIPDSGSNGLAIDLEGNILAGVHKDGSISRFALSGGSPTVVVGQYNGARFNSPNDLAVRSDGTIYFSDPAFQAPNSRPQAQTYVYRLPPGGEAEPIPNAAMPEAMNNPNGVTLSLAEDYLYVAAGNGRRFAVMSDGTLGAGEDFPASSSADGMVIDCAGNLYVTKADTRNVEVYTADGDPIGTIMVPEVQAVTNVAFGGADHKTLYITGHGNEKGLFTLPLDIPGRPY